MHRSLLVCASTIIAFALAGCGGSDAFGPTRGEGSIPIGRAQTTDSKAASVLLRTGGNTYSLNVSGGTVYAPSTLLATSYEIEVSAPEGYTERFTLEPGLSPAESFDIQVLPSSRVADVTGVQLEHGPITLRLGESLKLKVKVTGSNINGLTPSFWSSGGVASVNRGGVVKGKVVGSGSVTVDILGQRATVPLVVIPGSPGNG